MLYRRQCLITGLVLASSGASFGLLSRRAQAQAVAKATAFVQQTGDRLVAIVNGNLGAADRRRGLSEILETAVDVDGIARFCLGRFWRTASPDQQQRFLAAFHEVLVTNISSKLGEYKGVTLAVQHGREDEDEAIVTT